jgi:hypothetical protein
MVDFQPAGVSNFVRLFIEASTAEKYSIVGAGYEAVLEAGDILNSVSCPFYERTPHVCRACCGWRGLVWEVLGLSSANLTTAHAAVTSCLHRTLQADGIGRGQLPVCAGGTAPNPPGYAQKIKCTSAHATEVGEKNVPESILYCAAALSLPKIVPF